MQFRLARRYPFLAVGLRRALDIDVATRDVLGLATIDTARIVSLDYLVAGLSPGTRAIPCSCDHHSFSKLTIEPGSRYWAPECKPSTSPAQSAKRGGEMIDIAGRSRATSRSPETA
jgi:hypothetical protein